MKMRPHTPPAAAASPFRVHGRGLTVNIRLSPGARMSGVMGLMEAGEGKIALKVSVNVPPEDGKANKALIALLAKEWGLPKSALSILSGDASRQKVLLIEGDGAALMGSLSAWLENL